MQESPRKPRQTTNSGLTFTVWPPVCEKAKTKINNYSCSLRVPDVKQYSSTHSSTHFKFFLWFE